MSQNQQGDKAQKEQYLSDQVEKGLDADLCAQFLVSLKPEGGDDIDNWSLSELKSAIEQFKESQKQAEEQQPNNSEDQSNLQQAQPQEQPQQNQQINQQSNTPVLVNCYQILPNELSGDNVSAKIVTYKKESAGFFSSSYIVFQIETQPHGWVVFRRYSDFEWLRDSLQKFYPAFVVPPIHKKRSRSFEDTYLNKRVIFMQRFLNSIFKSYELKSNIIVKNFLSLTQNNEFKKFQESITKSAPPQTVQRMFSKEGQVNCVAPGELHQYAQQTQDYFYEIDGVYKKLRVLSKSLKEIQQQNSLKIYCVGEIFASLFQHLNKLNQVLPTGQAQGLAATSRYYKQHYDYLGQYYWKINRINRGHYNSSIKQIYETRAVISQDLEKFKSKLHYKKERLFQLGDISKWDLSKDIKLSPQELQQNKKLAFQYMCDQETKQEMGMEMLVGYYTNQIFSQTQQFFKQQQQELVGHFIKFCQVQAFNITDHHQLWADAITNLQNNLLTQKRQTQQVVIESVG
ncbi:unnamed protein product (macronuclear) [Paramecium tetraurelia]|uniref:PX domain-containing protein n=1 Tax=Paramecium tetraurelia TaxID=5888 RepID=A0CMY7_PARTE|nr:uncharacterized protein GSPATT00008595001 [Paramecium tetraurelia]CAK72154.1 unnamed protein product [Paramecium tetraurelia]|eukprot:XP_001439551.1 hypothetical protein (macronuclear) [Paramecium tetraurelia strain d4-2]